MNLELLSLSIIAVFLALTVWMIWPMVIGAIFVPTPMDTVRKMLDMARVKEGDLVVDLGAGDGRIVLEAAKTYGANSLGVEADPLRVLWARSRIRSIGLQGRAGIIWGNFFRTDLSKATVVTVYQGQGINNRLRKKFEKELSPGTRVVSYSFTFDGWAPREEESDVYLYIIPDK